ncbi:MULTISPECIES: DUF1700 domain-containing protein [Streptococcus]|uniref:DUF1700 domain-containing protein n=1 Tax=Streptococcus caledonicus TaxID=2614158 RepID=A0ABW0UAW7_9STRE|nr:DUF1700 domain-containing protein [Streptococcus sp. S784/96/1]
MTRTEYLAELEKELRQLPKKDFQEAMDYFTEYFDEAGPENEADLMAELGTPQEAASDILVNVIGKEDFQSNKFFKRPRSGKEIALLVGLILMASPVLFLVAGVLLGLLLAAIALLIGLAGFVIAMIILIACLLLTGFLLSVAAIIIAFVTLGESLTIFNSSWPAMTMGFGGFFAAIGGGVLIFLFSLYLTKLYGRGLMAFGKWLSNSLKNLWNKRKWRKSHEY